MPRKLSLQKSLASLFLLIISLGVSVSASGQSSQGTITGTVTDQAGAVIANATVTALQVETNQKYTVTSSAEGVFAIPLLPIGRYELGVTATGFSNYRQANIVLEVAQRLRLDVVLQVGDVSTTVTVTDEVSRVQTEA